MRSSKTGSLGGSVLFTLLLLPLLGYFALTVVFPERDALVRVPLEHFYIVSAAALAALAMAIVIGIASVRTREPRTVAVALGFLAVAGIFSVHGLMTPGDHMIVGEMHNSLVISARLSLFIGSLCFLLAAFEPPQRVVRAIRARHGLLLGGSVIVITAYVFANLLVPHLLDWFPTGEPTATSTPVVTTSPAPSGESGTAYGFATGEAPADVNERSVRSQSEPTPVYTRAERFGRGLALVMAVFATVALAIAAWRFFDTYVYTRTPATLTLAAGLLLLGEGQIIMALGEVWHLSWWLYHGALLFGFGIPVAGIALAYRRGSNLSEIVDGLFVRDTLVRMERSFPDAINALIEAIERRDPYTRGHMRRVAELTLAIAEEMRIPSANARAASHAALLHDIGKLGIPESVLHKPGALSDEEFAILREHPARGHQMVNQAPALLAAAPAIRWHHERLDGSGYPDGLSGNEIPLEARIVAVADVWDALTSDRVYREAMSDQTARRIVQSESGHKLDPDCVAALFAVLDRADRPAIRPVPRAVPGDARPSYLAS